MKTCKKCNQDKPLDSFTVDARYRDGRYPWCAECRRAWRQARKDKQRGLHHAWSDRNREHVREKGRESYHKHKDKIAPRRREYDRRRWRESAEVREHKRNQDRARYHTSPTTQARKKESHRRYYARHRHNPEFRRLRQERGKVHVHRRRLRIRNAGKYTVAQWRELCAKYNHCCLICGQQKPLTPDHITPLSRGGTNTIENIQPLCLDCNMRKYTKTIDYRQERGD